MAAMRALLIAAFAAIALTPGCALFTPPAAYQARALPGDELQSARGAVRGYAKTHCGTCHQSTLPSARPAALAIFNLDADTWSSTITASQLQNGFPRRLEGRLDERGKVALRTFIEGELALR